MMHVEAGVAFAGPTVPGYTCRLAEHGWNMFDHFGFHRKAKGLEREAQTLAQLRPVAVVKLDVR